MFHRLDRVHDGDAVAVCGLLGSYFVSARSGSDDKQLAVYSVHTYVFLVWDIRSLQVRIGVSAASVSSGWLTGVS